MQHLSQPTSTCLLLIHPLLRTLRRILVQPVCRSGYHPAAEATGTAAERHCQIHFEAESTKVPRGVRVHRRRESDPQILQRAGRPSGQVAQGAV